MPATQPEIELTAQEFRMLRKQAGFDTQREAADYIGVTTSCVKKWENGERQVQQYAVNCLSRKLHSAKSSKR